jgi:two-component system, NtrC family, sensor kinase
MSTYVLYVDDDVANLVVFEAICAGAFPVLTATSAKAAIELLETHHVGVLLTDQRMPGQTGVELLERARIVYPDTIRLLVTAYSDLQAAVDAINRGHVRRYLRKPWDHEELRGELRDSLELYELTRRVRTLEKRVRETERVYALGVVAASVAHEIRNPIGWVVNNCHVMRLQIERLRKEVASPDLGPERIAEEIARMEEALEDVEIGAQRVIEVVKGVEISSRPSAHDDQLVDLGQIMQWTLKLVRGVAQYDARFDVAPGPWPTIRGSANKVCQVLLNLLTNAIHAVRDAAPGRRWVRLRHITEDAWVFIEVEDGGPGVPQTIGEKIFDPFFTTKDGEGSGLGLAISRNIAREMGGDLELVPSDGTTSGALFRFRVPILGAK